MIEKGEINGRRDERDDWFDGNLSQICQLQPFVPSNSSNLITVMIIVHQNGYRMFDGWIVVDEPVFEGIGNGTDSGGGGVHVVS